MADIPAANEPKKPSLYEQVFPHGGPRLAFNYNKRARAKKTIGTTRQIPNK